MGNVGPWSWAPLAATAFHGYEGDDIGVEVVEGVLGDGDPHEGVVVGLVISDFEAECLEECSQGVVGGVEEVDLDDGELVEQFDGDGLRGLGCFDGGESVELGLAFGFELAEPVTDPGEDGAGGVVLGFERSDESILTACDLVEGATQSVEGGSLVCDGVVVEGTEVRCEQLGAAGAEESGGEELGHPGE